MAITLADSNSANSSSGTVNCALAGSTTNVGDLIVAYMMDQAGSGHTFTVNDNLNSGNYSQDNNTSAGGIQTTVFHKVCTGSAASVTVSCAGGGGDNINLFVLRFTGFINTATVIPADQTSNEGVGTTATGTGFSSSKNNELLLGGLLAGGANTFTLPSGWTSGINPGAARVVYQIQATSGTAISLSSTVSASDTWQVVLTGFNDQAVSTNTAPIAWVS